MSTTLPHPLGNRAIEATKRVHLLAHIAEILKALDTVTLLSPPEVLKGHLYWGIAQ